MTDKTQVYPYRSNSSEPTTVEIESSFVRFKPMISPEDVVKFGLVGIPKTFPLTNEPLSLEYVANQLEAVISELEMKGLCITPVISTHVDDWHEANATSRFFPTLLNKWPLSRVESMTVMFPHATSATPQASYTIPDAWITSDFQKVNVTVGTGIISPIISGGVSPIPLFHWANKSYRPNAYKIVYQAGFENDKLPAMVWQFLIDKTTVRILNDIGPLLFPHESLTVAIDSVSQTSKLPGRNIFQARLERLDRALAATWKTIEGYYGAGVRVNFMGL